MVRISTHSLLGAWSIGIVSCARIQIIQEAQVAEGYCKNSDSIMGYEYSHDGTWEHTEHSEESCAIAQGCADMCSNSAGCVAFAHSTLTHRCYIFRGSLGARSSSGSTFRNEPSSFRAYWRCDGHREENDGGLFISGPPDGLFDAPAVRLYRDAQVPSLEHTERWEAALQAVPHEGAADVSVEVDLAAQFCALAYGVNSDVQVLATRVGPEVLQVEIHGTEDFEEGAHVVVYLYRLSQGGIGVVLSYKGSTGDLDFAANFHHASIQNGTVQFNAPLFSEITGRPTDLNQMEEDATCHPGFLDYKGTLDEAMRAWDMQSISRILNDEWGAPAAPNFLSWLRAGHWRWCIVTGHSLGAGLAAIVSTDLAVRTRRQVLLATMAAPMAGNQAYVATQNAQVGPHGGLRIMNRADTVPLTGSIETMLQGGLNPSQMHGGLPVVLHGSFVPLPAHTDFTIATNVTGQITRVLYRMPGPTGYDPRAFRAGEDANELSDAGAGSLSPPLIPPQVLYHGDVQTPSVAEVNNWHQLTQNTRTRSPEEEMAVVDLSVRYAMLSYSRNDGLPAKEHLLANDVVELQFHDADSSASEGLHLVTYIYKLPEGGVGVVLSFKGHTGIESVTNSVQLLNTDDEIDAQGTLLFPDTSGFINRLASSAPRFVDLVRQAKVHPQFAQEKVQLDQQMDAWSMLTLAPVLRDWGVPSSEPNFLDWLRAGHWSWCAIVGNGAGGAVAAITAVELSVHSGKQPVLATLGAPTAGNTAFASIQTEFVSPAGGFRIFNNWDVFPNQGSDVSRRHAGRAVELPGQAFDRAPISAHSRYTVLSSISDQLSWVTFAFPTVIYNP